MGYAHGAHDGAILVEKGGLVRFELAHAPGRFHLLVEQARAPGAHRLFLRLQAHVLSGSVFFWADIPNVVVATTFDLLLRLVDDGAEGVVHLEMRSCGVFEPHEIGDGVDGGIKVGAREVQIRGGFGGLLQASEFKGQAGLVEGGCP